MWGETRMPVRWVRFVLHGGGLTLGGEVTVREYVRRGLLHTVPIRERGMHARSDMGATNLNRNVPVICDAILQIRND